MQNQFCKKCGQANFPNATSCSKCGHLIEVSSGVPQGFSAKRTAPEKKSNTKYWIIGGVLTVFLVVGVLGILVVGGFLVYLSSSDQITRENPVPESSTPTTDRTDDRRDAPTPTTSRNSDNPLDDVTFPTGKDVTFGDETKTTMNDKVLLNFFLQRKKVVGRFKLFEVKTSTSREFFPNRSAGVQAEYRSGRKRLFHRVAIYKSVENARSDILAYKRNVKSSGAKIRSSTQTRLVFVLKGVVYLAFYNAQGGLHEMSSRNGNDISKYFAAYSRAGK